MHHRHVLKHKQAALLATPRNELSEQQLLHNFSSQEETSASKKHVHFSPRVETIPAEAALRKGSPAHRGSMLKEAASAEARR